MATRASPCESARRAIRAVDALTLASSLGDGPLSPTGKDRITVEEKANPLLALKVRNFRLYWFALLAQVIGQHMFAFTLGWLAFEITGSQAQLGLVHLCGF